MKFYTNLNKVR